MMPDWVKEVVLWAALFFSGYWTCHYRLEAKVKKQYELKAAKLLKTIEDLKRKEKPKSS